jgi:hypothetical protein
MNNSTLHLIELPHPSLRAGRGRGGSINKELTRFLLQSIVSALLLLSANAANSQGSDAKWVDSVYNSLTMEQRIA